MPFDGEEFSDVVEPRLGVFVAGLFGLEKLSPHMRPAGESHDAVGFGGGSEVRRAVRLKASFVSDKS